MRQWMNSIGSGEARFSTSHGFGEARGFLRIGDKRHDSKAIAGAAHGYQFPSLGPLPAVYSVTELRL